MNVIQIEYNETWNNRSYKKVVNGKELFGRLDPDIAYQKYPKLKALVDKMLELPKATQFEGGAIPPHILARLTG